MSVHHNNNNNMPLPPYLYTLDFTCKHPNCPTSNTMYSDEFRYNHFLLYKKTNVIKLQNSTIQPFAMWFTIVISLLHCLEIHQYGMNNFRIGGIIFPSTKVSVTNWRNRWNQCTEIEIYYILTVENYTHIRHCLDMCELKCTVQYSKCKLLFLFLENFVISYNL